MSSGVNADLVESFFTANHFSELFPIADSAYTYANFITAVKKFPNFCNNIGYFGSNGGLTVEETCKKQIAGLLTLVAMATNKKDMPTSADDTATRPLHEQGLHYTADPCIDDTISPCIARPSATTAYGTAAATALLGGVTLNLEDWVWPLDEGLFEVLVNGVTTVED